ncbi:hypothetical protein F4679DRAFT_544708 [Xylaria curta]|nr:hypothetical protein F4679DRAFT_544708 [Xylaria curta]
MPILFSLLLASVGPMKFHLQSRLLRAIANGVIFKPLVIYNMQKERKKKRGEKSDTWWVTSKPPQGTRWLKGALQNDTLLR